MQLKKSFFIGVMVVLSVVLFSACQKTDQAVVPTFESKSDDQAGITVTVTPVSFDESSNFEIILDTHSGDLSVDLAKVATLVDSAGKSYLPVAWEGDPPEGHHRSGILKFPLVDTDGFVIKIVDVSGGEERVFEWGANDVTGDENVASDSKKLEETKLDLRFPMKEYHITGCSEEELAQAKESLIDQEVSGDIHPDQVDDCFLLADYVFALVKQPNMNFDLPNVRKWEGEGHDAWSGVIVKPVDGDWQVFTKVDDRFNPIHFYNSIYKKYSLDVADDSGAGSGEGKLIRYTFPFSKNQWEKSCESYYVPEEYTFFTLDC